MLGSDFFSTFSYSCEHIPIMFFRILYVALCGPRYRSLKLRLRAGEVADQFDKLAAPVLEVLEHVVTGAGGAEEDDVAGGGEVCGEADCFGE